MKIGFDAKRAYQNSTGLGNYSRSLLTALINQFPENEYFLFAPKATARFPVSDLPNTKLITPEGFPDAFLRSAWRSRWVKKDLEKYGIEVYHGLSHEIPVGIQKTATRSVVTIHDLIHEIYPGQYSRLDAKIYQWKSRYACRNADAVIAISEQTKKDIIEHYQTPAEKIHVCYQACNPAFSVVYPENEKNAVKQKYVLPDAFFLYVGSIIERKNLLTIAKAMKILEGKTKLPLVIIGDGGRYKARVIAYARQNGLANRLIFLADSPSFRSIPDDQRIRELAMIYRLATLMIYPSVYEGFGLPVLESLCSGLPVITSNLSCLPETGGDAAICVDPGNPGQMAEAMLKVSVDETLRQSMIAKGYRHAEKFLPGPCAGAVMEVYKKMMDNKV